MQRIRIFMALALWLTGIGIGQAQVSEKVWQSLTDVQFAEKYNAEVDAYYYYPTFGPKVKNMEGKEMEIRGYVIPVDPTSNMYVLSYFPYSMCFFCGGAGPESIVELKLKDKKAKYKVDQIVTFRGKFRLNADNIYECNYILDDAVRVADAN